VANFREDKNARQIEALRLLDSGKIKFLLYGGALGGGKSRFLRWYAPRYLMRLYSEKGLKNTMAMLACEDYPSLQDRQLSKIYVEFPGWMGRFYDSHKVYGRCYILNPEYGSGVICFRNLDDPAKYASAEFALVLIDELTKNALDVFTDLRHRLRWPGLKDIECQFVAGSNPGSVGHGWVKQLWISRVYSEEWIKPIDYRPQFAFVPAKATDNPYLDSSYHAYLNTLPQHLRKAFRDGDWNVFIGQAFPELSKTTHAYDGSDIAVLPKQPLLWSFDWGFGKPFSMGWYFMDGDKRLFRCAEWYGWTDTPDSGLRLEDSAIAEGLLEREKKWGFDQHPIDRIASPDCFSRKPNYKGGGQGPSTAQIFREKGIIVRPGDPDRALKIRQVRERLRVRDGQFPMLMVDQDRCPQFWRTMGDLPMDANNIEDVDTDAEDHVYDEVALMCMARPLDLEIKPEVIIRAPKTGTSMASIAAQKEREEVKQMLQEQDSGDGW